MKSTALKPKPISQTKDIDLYQIGGRTIAVRKTKPVLAPVKEITPKREFLGTVTTDSGKIKVTDIHEPELYEGLSFPAGLGAGTYEAYATIQHIPGHGERITKLEIELVPDWELAEYHKQDAMGGR